MKLARPEWLYDRMSSIQLKRTATALARICTRIKDGEQGKAPIVQAVSHSHDHITNPMWLGEVLGRPRRSVGSPQRSEREMISTVLSVCNDD
jgi:hypothetical protein